VHEFQQAPGLLLTTLTNSRQSRIEGNHQASWEKRFFLRSSGIARPDSWRYGSPPYNKEMKNKKESWIHVAGFGTEKRNYQ
jgi:hypothetical protein